MLRSFRAHSINRIIRESSPMKSGFLGLLPPAKWRHSAGRPKIEDGWKLAAIRTLLFVGTTVASIITSSSPALAQASTAEDDLPPVRAVIDQNGVNTMLGPWFHGADVGLVSDIDPDLKVNQFWISSARGWAPSWDFKVTNSGALVVTVGQESYRFPIPVSYGGEYLSDDGHKGHRLRFDNSQKKYIFIHRDGTTATLETVDYSQYGRTYGSIKLPNHGYATSVVFPNGKSWAIAYDTKSIPTDEFLDPIVRTRSIASSNGIAARITYQSDDQNSTSWQIVSSTIIFNTAAEFCDLNAPSCNFTNNWPTIQRSRSAISNVVTDVFTDATGGQWTYTATRFRMASVRIPGNLVDSIALTWWDAINTAKGWAVTSIVINGVRYNYSYSDVLSGGHIQKRTAVVTDPAGKIKSYTGHPTSVLANEFLLDTYTDELGQAWNFEYDPNDRLTKIQFPEGNVIKYIYDTRGNITEERRISKTPNSPADIVTSYIFPASCTYSASCNKPSAKIDPRGNQTDFTYAPIHGGVLIETGPAVNGIRPQKRYTYVQRYAWLKNAGGTYAQAATPAWLLNSESYCRTSAANGTGCSLIGDEVVTTYDYGPNSGPNNLLLRGIVVTAGGQSRRTCYTYDTLGRKISETTPNANLTSCP